MAQAFVDLQGARHDADATHRAWTPTEAITEVERAEEAFESWGCSVRGALVAAQQPALCRDWSKRRCACSWRGSSSASDARAVQGAASSDGDGVRGRASWDCRDAVARGVHLGQRIETLGSAERTTPCAFGIIGHSFRSSNYAPPLQGLTLGHPLDASRSCASGASSGVTPEVRLPRT